MSKIINNILIRTIRELRTIADYTKDIVLMYNDELIYLSEQEQMDEFEERPKYNKNNYIMLKRIRFPNKK